MTSIAESFSTSTARRPKYLAGVRDFGKRLFSTKIGAISTSLLIFMFVATWVGPLLYDTSPNQQSTSYLANPSWDHPAGTDVLGRDTLSRLLEGGRISFVAAFGAGILGFVIAFPLGLAAGRLKGVFDRAAMGVIETIYAFPTVLLALGLVAVLGPGLDKVIIAIAIWGIPTITRLVRAQTFAVEATDYVLSARATGASEVRVLARHIAPNVVSPALIQVTMVMSGAILIEASLGFLGAGVPAPTATWGGMLLEAFPTMRIAPWQAIAPGLVIFALVLSLNLLGDALRDLHDPRLRNR